MRVLRLCSVFEPPGGREVADAAFDPIGGMQNHAAALTRALDERGVHQTVVTTGPPGAPRVEELGRHGRVVRLGLGVPWLRQLYSVQAAPTVPALAAEADLVHAHLGEDLAVLPLGVAAARRRSLPLVVTVHCSLRHTIAVTDVRSAVLRTVGGAIERWAERRADAVVVLTTRLAERLAADGLEPGRIHVVPSGVEPGLFEGPHPDPCPAIAHPRVAFVGRLAPQKGVRTLVEATALLASDATLVLVGDGPERAAIERRVAELGIGERVTITGFVPHHAVPGFMAHADVLVLPSIYEELGSVLVEAMQAGLPVVASAVGGIPDLVADGGNGLLVPPSDPRALAAALQRVLRDHDLARRLSAASRAGSVEYHWPSLAERILDVYLDVAGRLHARAGTPGRT